MGWHAIKIKQSIWFKFYLGYHNSHVLISIGLGLLLSVSVQTNNYVWIQIITIVYKLFV